MPKTKRDKIKLRSDSIQKSLLKIDHQIEELSWIYANYPKSHIVKTLQILDVIKIQMILTNTLLREMI